MVGALSANGRSRGSLLSRMRSGFFSSRSWLSSESSSRWAAKCSISAGPPCVAAFGVAERVELERHAADAELGQQLRPKGENLDVGLRLGRADDLGVELVELAVAALLRPLVAEGGAMGRDLQRRNCCQPSLR